MEANRDGKAQTVERAEAAESTDGAGLVATRAKPPPPRASFRTHLLRPEGPVVEPQQRETVSISPSSGCLICPKWLRFLCKGATKAGFWFSRAVTDENAKIPPRASGRYAAPPNNKGINRNPAEAAASSIPLHARRPLHPRRLNITQNETRYLGIHNGPTVARHFHGNNDFTSAPAEKRSAPSSFL